MDTGERSDLDSGSRCCCDAPSNFQGKPLNIRATTISIATQAIAAINASAFGCANSKLKLPPRNRPCPDGWIERQICGHAIQPRIG